MTNNFLSLIFFRSVLIHNRGVMRNRFGRLAILMTLIIFTISVISWGVPQVYSLFSASVGKLATNQTIALSLHRYGHCRIKTKDTRLHCRAVSELKKTLDPRCDEFRQHFIPLALRPSFRPEPHQQKIYFVSSLLYASSQEEHWRGPFEQVRSPRTARAG